MKRRWITAVAASLLVLGSALVPTERAEAVSTAPTPVVQGNQLVDSRNGTVFVPRGVNWPGFEYSCWQGWEQLPAANEAAAIASWQINTVRLPLNQDCWLGLQGSPNGQTVAHYKAAIASWVAALNAVGVVVILDLHSSAPLNYPAHGQRAMADAQSVAFWTSVATAYQSNKSVIFDLFNEPYSRGSFQLTWDCWKNGGCQAPVEDDYTSPLSGAKYTVTGMAALVAAVRGAGATQPLMLGGLNYSNDLTGWLANRPNDTQLVASWHNYPGQGCSDVSCWTTQILPVAAVVPIVTGEFGNTAETTSTAPGSHNYLVPFMDWADAHGIGYLPWAWWDVSAGESVPNSVYALYSGSSFTPKSPSGTKFHDHLAALSASTVPLPPGTLVKTSTSPTVYLVDGATRLIPLAAFSSATDAGISAAFTTVAPGRISGYTVATSPLSNVVTCASQNYVAAQSMLWPVDSALVAGLAKSSLDSTTCAAIPKSATTVSGALFLKSTTSPSLYAISATGAKRPILTMETLALMSAPSTPVYLTVGAYFINSLPLGAAVLPPGRLVKTPAAPTVYLADGFSTVVPLAAFSSATDAGISQQFFTVSPSDLAGVTIAPSPLTQRISCGGSDFISGSGMLWPITAALAAGIPVTSLDSTTCSVIPRSATPIEHALFARTASNPTVYNVTASGGRVPMATWDAMVAMSAPGPTIYLTVGDYFLSALPDVVTTGMLVKSPASPTVYIADSPTSLIPLRTFDSIAEFGLPTGYSVVSAATIAARTISASPLSNVVNCGGETLLGMGGTASAVSIATIGPITTTTMATALCAMLPRSTRDTDPLLIKSPSEATLYLVEGGVKKPIRSWATVLTLSGGMYYTVNAAWVATVPTGGAIP